jgi:hypothetical protein
LNYQKKRTGEGGIKGTHRKREEGWITLKICIEVDYYLFIFSP